MTLTAGAAACVAAWAKANGTPESFGAPVPLAQKLERERRADHDRELVEGILRRWPARAARREAWRQELLGAMRRIAQEHLACDAEALNQLFSDAGVEATHQFLRKARAFAPGITDQDLFQALRNVWVMHSVQLLMQAPVELNPAVFAYSMLYPWTDNYLDDPHRGRAAKMTFGEWLAQRLAGGPAPVPDTHCEEVSALVGIIERLYPRAEFPEVYRSLQAIHRAQMQSLDSQDTARPWDPETLLEVSIAKGGASVVADACLVRGWLTGEEAEFMYAYGVVLQLMDDLQDLREDLANGLMTLFSRQAKAGVLDELTCQLWGFTQGVLREPSAPKSLKAELRTDSPAQPASVKRLIQDNLRYLLMQSVARNREFYSPAFVSRLEEASPVRFCYLARQEKTLADRYSEVLGSMRRKRRLRSVFDLLG